jgi:DNA repair exonuclease SbcCD ATPase subunit
MSSSFSRAVDALTAQARSLVEAASGEIDALREELEQERRFRRHLEATAATRAHEWAARQEEGRQERERLEAELAEAREGRRLAEAEVDRFHEAVREQLAIAEREQAALEQAERERERLREEQLEQRLQEAAEAAAHRETLLQEAAEGQRQALLQDLAREQRARLSLERRLTGVRQAVLDLLAPQGSEEEATAAGSEEVGVSLDGCGEFTDGTGRMALRKILVPRQVGPISQQALT